MPYSPVPKNNAPKKSTPGRSPNTRCIGDDLQRGWAPRIRYFQVADSMKSRLVGIFKKGMTSYPVLWMFPKIVVPPQIIHFNRVFHYINHPFWVPLFFETPLQGLFHRQ